MADPGDRSGLLEEQVRLLAAGHGLHVDDPAGVVPPEIVALARQGKQVEAVRALRKAGFGLVAAKRVVDAASRVC